MLTASKKHPKSLAPEARVPQGFSRHRFLSHGGGILSNGYLILGKPTTNSVDTGKPVEVIASKALLGTDGTALANMGHSPQTWCVKRPSS